jgi:hypothetical protein
MYKAHREEYMKDMDRKWKEGAAERQRLWEEMKKRPKIVIPQVNYTPVMKIGMIAMKIMYLRINK